MHNNVLGANIGITVLMFYPHVSPARHPTSDSASWKLKRQMIILVFHALSLLHPPVLDNNSVAESRRLHLMMLWIVVLLSAGPPIPMDVGGGPRHEPSQAHLGRSLL